MIKSMDERKGKISASGFSRAAICPKSWQLSKGLPSIETADSTRGTILHNCCKEIIEMGETNFFGISLDDQNAVKWCVEKVREFADGCTIQTELRLWIDDIISGQIDALIINGIYARVFDYKFGVNPVEEAEYNFQLMIYALLVLANFPQVEEVEVGVLAPCVLGEKEPQKAVYVRSQYDELLTKVKAVIARAESVDAPYCKDIGSHCQYCRARAICEKQKQNIEVVCKESELANKSLEITKDNVQTLAKQVKFWTKRMNEAQKTVDAIKDNIIKFAQENPDCGVELKDGRAINKFDAMKTYGALQDVVSATQFISVCDVNKKRLLDVIAETTGLPKSKAEQTLIDTCESAGAITTTCAKSTIK